MPAETLTKEVVGPWRPATSYFTALPVRLPTVPTAGEIDPWGSKLVCPVCGSDYVHVGGVAQVDGNDSYQAWTGRGDAVGIALKGECGHSWSIALGSHKAQTYLYVSNAIPRLEHGG